MSRRIVVVGGGVVGASLAASLIERAGLAVTVLERGPRDRLVGSTGHAPGFVGLLGEAPVATALARASAACYERLEHGGRAGFDRVGGLEVAYPPAAMSDLERRAALADGADLGARVLDPAQAVALAPGLVDPERCVGGVLYPQDGTARAGVITAALKDRAARAGVEFRYDAPVTAIDTRAGRVIAVRTGGQTLPADDVVLACGVWGPAVAALAGQQMPLTPVAHPTCTGRRTTLRPRRRRSCAGRSATSTPVTTATGSAWAPTTTRRCP